MTMTFFLHDSIQPNAPLDLIEHGAASRRATGEFPILPDKLRMPDMDGLIERERLHTLLERSRTQFPATLISGRAGTGKTALAASFARAAERSSWYTVETTDVDWSVFSRYFSQCLAAAGFGDSAKAVAYEPQNEIAAFLAKRLMRPEPARTNALIVLDDVHHIFDSDWFGEFFKLLLYSLPTNAHVLLLCRSKPPSPLWRLRSKQVLNVIDEDQLAFTTDEVAELFARHGRYDIGPEAARIVAFGRAAKLVELAREGRAY
ncbi:MAG TPA: AAA family ATPase [Pyrinomonadaceae bacterium]|nr:AAA family ATPase [Pyrinomonadaceae bacterium]